jgi:hypothetical protein
MSKSAIKPGKESSEPKAEKRPFHFPEDGAVVEAATLEEAQAEHEKLKAGRE